MAHFKKKLLPLSSISVLISQTLFSTNILKILKAFKLFGSFFLIVSSSDSGLISKLSSFLIIYLIIFFISPRLRDSAIKYRSCNIYPIFSSEKEIFLKFFDLIALKDLNYFHLFYLLIKIILILISYQILLIKNNLKI